MDPHGCAARRIDDQVTRTWCRGRRRHATSVSKNGGLRFTPALVIWSRARARSVRQRSNYPRFPFEASLSGSPQILIAISRLSRVSLARYTSPMPPLPIGATSSYGPSLVPTVTCFSPARSSSEPALSAAISAPAASPPEIAFHRAKRRTGKKPAHPGCSLNAPRQVRSPFL